MIQAWTGRDCCTGEELRVECENGRITSIGSDTSGDDAWLAPGLIDLQVNGFRGHDINATDLTAETVRRLAFSMLATGVTTFVPTLITASEEKLIHHLRVIAAARQADPLLTQMIPFVHMEGPHIAPEDGPRGAHPVEHVRPPNMDEFMRWQAASGNLVGMVTISPHYLIRSRTFGHSLRAGFVTEASANGATHDQIMKQTGHTSEAMVRRYARADREDKQAAGSKLGL